MSLNLPNGYMLVERREWNGRPLPSLPAMPGPVRIMRVHHTVTAATADPCIDFRTVDRVLRSRGLDGYNYLIHPSGVVGELCGVKRGEHTADHNSDSYSLSFIGNFEHDQPTLAALIAAARTTNLMIMGGHVLPAPTFVPHFATSKTACPGINLGRSKINGRTAVEWVQQFQREGI